MLLDETNKISVALVCAFSSRACTVAMVFPMLCLEFASRCTSVLKCYCALSMISKLMLLNETKKSMVALLSAVLHLAL